MYGVGGERSFWSKRSRLFVHGYDHARPVRIGNGASPGITPTRHLGSILDSFHLRKSPAKQVPEPMAGAEAASGAIRKTMGPTGNLGGARRGTTLHVSR